MNYIRHLEGFYIRLAEDRRLTPFHVSLYLALFRQWNRNRFRNPFPVSREELMFFSRIGSVNTYTRCIKQLDEWDYIDYFPSNSPHIGSHVSCISFDKADDKAGNNSADQTGDNTAETFLINSTNKTKDSKQASFNKKRNGEQKSRNRDNHYHVREDKDFSEPL